MRYINKQSGQIVIIWCIDGLFVVFGDDTKKPLTTNQLKRNYTELTQ